VTQGASRRRRWTVAAGIGLLVAVSAGAWFVWLPNWRPALRSGERYGIDVSAHQGAIDWDRVAHDRISFAYIKATEGGDFVDARFTVNWAGARRAGITAGAYHLFSLCTPGDLQARHFLGAAPPDATMPPAVDLELAGNCSLRPDPSTVRHELASFLTIVEAASRENTVLYVGEDFQQRYSVGGELQRPLWKRRLLRRPDGDGWTIWQIHGFAHIAGIRGRVDLDIMRS